MVGGNYMAKLLNQTGIIIVTEKSETLGANHPDNKSGQEYFSKAKFFDVYDKDWKKILEYQIDERGFNTLRWKHGKLNDITKPIHEWIMDEFNKMKSSNPDYGTHSNTKGKEGKEGKEKLYAFKFINWLSDRQITIQ